MKSLQNQQIAQRNESPHQTLKVIEDEDVDFKNLSLGCGSNQEKKYRLEHIVSNIVNNEKQFKVAKDILKKIKANRNRKIINVNQSCPISPMPSDFVSLN